MTGADHDHHAAMSRAVRELEVALQAAGILTTVEVDEHLDRLLATATPRNGARIVARAWIDGRYRQRLLDDGNSAIAELGYGLDDLTLRVVENTASVHNVIVCTLCSCYPIQLLGPPPSWYRSESYRSRVVREPREVLAEFGLHLPAGTRIRVWDSTADRRYLVLPRSPAHITGKTEPELAALVTRDGLIGAGVI
jgi:nitrile hydratase